MVAIKVLNRQWQTVAVERGEVEAVLTLKHEYEEGDRIEFEFPEGKAFWVLQADDAIGEAFVYVTENKISYEIPFGDKKVCYSPKCFFGDYHLITARAAYPEEIASYRNLAVNAMDQHGVNGCYPHAEANVETRGEAVFAARNAIDGIKANQSHGGWPFGSWGINRDPEAKMKVLFGREIRTDHVTLYLRADFPHDNWWRELTLRFSDDSTVVVKPQKTKAGQRFSFEPKVTQWVQVEGLIQSDEPSPFPALTQIEVYGTNV